MTSVSDISRRDYLMAVLSGVLLALSFPNPGISVFAWFAFVPLLLVCGRREPSQAFRLGFVAGLTAYAGIFYWINIVVTTYGKLPWVASVPLTLMLAAYLALYPGITLWLARRGELRGFRCCFRFRCSG